MNSPSQNSVFRVLLASLAGTAIEFFDFYIYATAAVLVFPKLFFPQGDPTAATLQSLATFSLAFFARPLGSVFFGHFGDRIGRKATLVAALLTMGVSTVLIGLLPTYASIGLAASGLLALCRFGQGFGLGGEWGGAVLLATENAPSGKRDWYGMFPQLGAPIGFLFSGAIFLLLSKYLDAANFLTWGWRVPFLASSALVLVGLYVRLNITETPAFLEASSRGSHVALPMVDLLRNHLRTVILGTFAAVATFVIFYILIVFSLSWGTTHLGYSRETFLIIQLVGVLFFALSIPCTAWISSRIGRRNMLLLASLAIFFFGLFFGRIFSAGTPGVVSTLVIGFLLMGVTYAPLGTFLSELFPVEVRYTGASITFNIAGILGASLTPYLATSLAIEHGLGSVGLYLAGMSAISLIALILTKQQRGAGEA
ncbi:MAG: MHS family MFS transporter [Verrucomicrobia bacterium]|jgi:MFS family permease|nr:MAG: MHS family MFS transporter [Verrucomicrobiota bacterium]